MIHNKSRLILIGLAVLLAGFYIQNNIVSVYFNMHGNDFAHLYLGAYLAKQGKNFYCPQEIFDAAQRLGIQRVNPFVYPPIVAIFFIPLSLLSYPIAQEAWFIFNHVFLIIGLGLLIATFDSEHRLIYVISALGLTFNFYPLYRTLTAGQLNLLILFLLCFAWFLFVKKSQLWSGMILGIATLIKLFPGLFILFFLWKREYKLAVAALATIIILVGLSLAIQGIQLYQDYGTILAQMNYGRSTWSEFQQRFDVEPANQSIHALLLRLFVSNPVTTPVINLPVLAKLLSILFSIILLGVCIWLTYPREKMEPIMSSLQLEFSLILITALLIPSLLWDHYLVYFFLILLWLIDYWFKSSNFSIKSIIYTSILYLIMAIPYNFWSRELNSGFGIFLMSLKLYPVILIWLYLAYLIYTYRIDQQTKTTK
ncbi:MAG: DUF2029 domain-containing protein [bacterium]|nr:DUF2029 domain-containing protein [bacterium]